MGVLFERYKFTKKSDLRGAILLALFLGLTWNAQAQGKVTVQKQRQTPPDDRATESRSDGWGQPAPRRSSSRSSSAAELRANRRATERAFRRIEGDQPEIDFAPPQKLIEMSFRVAPSLSVNKTEGVNSYAGFSEDGAGLRMSVGPTLDYFFFKDRYAFSSGLWYTIRRSAYQIPGQFGQDVWIPGAHTQTSVYNLQYAQVPLTVKMYANNLFYRTRVYIQTGGLLNVKLAEKPLDQTRNRLYQYVIDNGSYKRQYSRGGFDLLLGAGIQYRLNQSQALVMGVSYQRGLIDIARARDLTSKSRVVALELGLKF